MGDAWRCSSFAGTRRQGHARSTASRCDFVEDATRVYPLHPRACRGRCFEREGAVSDCICVCFREGQEARFGETSSAPDGAILRWYSVLASTDQIYGEVGEGLRTRTTYAACRPIDRASIHVTHDHHTNEGCAQGRRMRTSRVWFACTRRTLTTSVADGCWLVCSGSEPRNGDRRRWWLMGTTVEACSGGKLENGETYTQRRLHRANTR